MVARAPRRQPKLVDTPQTKEPRFANPAPVPLTNYTLSTVCPACERETYKLACKVRCGNCGFMWDCSEL